MTQSIGTQMQENQTRAFKTIAYALGMTVYLGGVAYAEARAYSLFSRTIDPELLPVALIGIVALGLTALAAPLAHHFGTAPGVQRIFLDVFYAFDIFAMAANAVLDSALHDAASLTDLLQFWKVYVLPALPLVCLLGWTVFFMLDPAHRKRDLLLAARSATEEVLTSRMVEQMKATDLTDMVDAAARAAAADIVGRTVGAPPAVPASPALPAAPRGDTERPLPTIVVPKAGRNGRKAESAETQRPNG